MRLAFLFAALTFASAAEVAPSAKVSLSAADCAAAFKAAGFTSKNGPFGRCDDTVTDSHPRAA
jgi:hypothetical protein